MIIDARKETLIQIVRRWIERSGLSIEEIVTRMQNNYGCDIDRPKFENRFTTRADKFVKIPIDYMTALLEVLATASDGRSFVAKEVFKVIEIADLPFTLIGNLKPLFPERELDEALSDYGLRLSHKKNHELSKYKNVPEYDSNSHPADTSLQIHLAYDLHNMTNISPDVWLTVADSQLGRFDKETNMGKLSDWFHRLEKLKVNKKTLKRIAERVIEGNWSEWSVWHVSEVLPKLAKHTNYSPNDLTKCIYNSDIPIDQFKQIANHLSKLAVLGVGKQGRDQAFLIFLFSQSFVDIPPDDFSIKVFE